MRPTSTAKPTASASNSPSDLIAGPDYAAWLGELKSRIQSARSRAALAANQELVRLYHDIGREILARQAQQGWGARVINRLAADLATAFPDMKGLSSRNLKYMKVFAELCPALQIGQQPAAQLPWFHIVTLLTKVADPDQREWYATRAAERAWSRPTLEANIKASLHLREGMALTNFTQRLPETQAQLAREILKDPYHFDFLGLGDEAHERDIENALVRHITRFLLDLGSGFAFVGRQQRIEVAGDELFIDLLFYHVRLKRYVVVELKAGELKPEHAGQLNFYLAAVDAQLKPPRRQPHHRPPALQDQEPACRRVRPVRHGQTHGRGRIPVGPRSARAPGHQPAHRRATGRGAER